MVKSFNQKLTGLLKKDIRFVDEETGELIPNEIVNEALKIDKELISILLEDKNIKLKFFNEIKGHWVFNINDFIAFIQDKNFLSNSYTKFKNKIGLNINGKFLNERKEVSLVWPFKDCILEAGMSREDQARNEVFFNEVLAQDEIDRLLDPKVLTGFKKFSIKGEEKVNDFKRDKEGTIKENLIIKGNNLLALHSLKKEFAGKIKVIYIDPPYNTGGDSFNYNDNFNHSTWLTFMKNRLEVAKRLLKEDGVIFVHCDDNEQAYLKILMDEIFKRENFITNLIWKKKAGGANDSKYFAVDHENILVFCKDEKLLEKFWCKVDEDYKKQYKLQDSRGYYVLKNLYQGSIAEDRPNLKYPIKCPDGTVLHEKENGTIYRWRWEKKKFLEAEKNKEVVFRKIKGKWQIFTKQYLLNENGEERKIKPRSILMDKGMTRDGKEDLKKLFGISVFDYPKPVKLVKYLIGIIAKKDEIILDFHAGSGTVGHAVLELNKEGANRNFILIEQLEEHIKICTDRVQKVIKNDKLDEYFIYCELLKFNQEAIEKIQSTKDTKVLLKIWEEMCDQYFLNYDVSIKNFNENKKDFEKLSLVQQKKLLCEMLNKNQLYVNLSEIDDSQFKISKEDKELNKKFYK